MSYSVGTEQWELLQVLLRRCSLHGEMIYVLKDEIIGFNISLLNSTEYLIVNQGTIVNILLLN